MSDNPAYDWAPIHFYLQLYFGGARRLTAADELLEENRQDGKPSRFQ